jgi:hypothetical protein
MPYKTKIILNSRSLFLIISRIIAAGEPPLLFELWTLQFEFAAGESNFILYALCSILYNSLINREAIY